MPEESVLLSKESVGKFAGYAVFAITSLATAALAAASTWAHDIGAEDGPDDPLAVLRDAEAEEFLPDMRLGWSKRRHEERLAAAFTDRHEASKSPITPPSETRLVIQVSVVRPGMVVQVPVAEKCITQQEVQASVTRWEEADALWRQNRAARMQVEQNKYRASERHAALASLRGVNLRHLE